MKQPQTAFKSEKHMFVCNRIKKGLISGSSCVLKREVRITEATVSKLQHKFSPVWTFSKCQRERGGRRNPKPLRES